MTIPVKSFWFKQEMKKLKAKLPYRSYILHTTMTLILFIVAIFYFYICPQSLAGPISAYINFVMLAITPFICFSSYKDSNFHFNSFCYYKFICQLVCMIQIIQSIVSLEVIDITGTNNTKRKGQLNRDAFIMFFTMIVTHFNTKFFKKVVLAKKRAEESTLPTLWKN